MNQSWLTVIIAIITALTGVLSPVASKWAEQKASRDNASAKELRQLAYNLYDQSLQLWDESFTLMMAYYREIQFTEKLRQNGTPGEDEWYTYYAEESSNIDSTVSDSEEKIELINQQVKNTAFDLTIQFPALSKNVADLIDKAQPCHIWTDLDSEGAKDSFNTRFSKDFNSETFTGEDKKQWDMAQKNFQQTVARQLKKSH